MSRTTIILLAAVCAAVSVASAMLCADLVQMYGGIGAFGLVAGAPVLGLAMLADAWNDRRRREAA